MDFTYRRVINPLQVPDRRGGMVRDAASPARVRRAISRELPRLSADVTYAHFGAVIRRSITARNYRKLRSAACRTRLLRAPNHLPLSAGRFRRESASSGERDPAGRPLHGLPVPVKDNLATADRMHTTAGSTALLGCRPERDAVGVPSLPYSGNIRHGDTTAGAALVDDVDLPSANDPADRLDVLSIV
jgi:hypothetical protein